MRIDKETNAPQTKLALVPEAFSVAIGFARDADLSHPATFGG